MQTFNHKLEKQHELSLRQRVLKTICTCNTFEQLDSAVRYAELAGYLNDELVIQAVLDWTFYRQNNL